MQKRGFFLFVLTTVILLSGLLVVNASPIDTSLENKNVLGVNCNIVTVNLDSKDIVCGVSTGKDGMNDSEPFESQIKRNNADIACNGNFFQSYSPQGERNFWGLIVKNGDFISGGGQGTFLFGPDKNPTYLYRELDPNGYYPEYHNQGFTAGVSGDPSLLENGKNVVGTKYSTRKDLDQAAQRTGMGVTKDNKLKIVTCSASLKKLAEIMQNLGCVNAVNLDGGASSALYYRGKNVTSPGRDLNVVFYIKDLGKDKKIEQVKKDDSIEIKVSENKLVLNGEKIQVSAYNINGNNYFKLRDLARLLQNTSAKFNIKYYAEENAMIIEKGKNIISVDLLEELNEPKKVQKSKQKILIDGEKIENIKSYNVDGSNFFMLRDLSEILNFKTDFDKDTFTVKITTSEDKAKEEKVEEEKKIEEEK